MLSQGAISVDLNYDNLKQMFYQIETIPVKLQN